MSVQPLQTKAGHTIDPYGRATHHTVLSAGATPFSELQSGGRDTTCLSARDNMGQSQVVVKHQGTSPLAVGNGAPTEGTYTDAAMHAAQVPKVVNVTTCDEWDVYVGRVCKSAPPGSTGEWGNPFKIPRAIQWTPRSSGQLHAAHQQAVDQYRHWLLLEQPELLARAREELAGKVLGCFCAPLPCHADVLACVSNASDDELKRMVAAEQGGKTPGAVEPPPVPHPLPSPPPSDHIGQPPIPRSSPVLSMPPARIDWPPQRPVIDTHTLGRVNTVALVPLRIALRDPHNEGAPHPMPEIMALVPCTGCSFGCMEPDHPRQGRRESAVQVAARLLPDFEAPADTYFFAAELDALGDSTEHGTARTSVVTAPVQGAPGCTVMRTPADMRLAKAENPQGQVWATLDALADDEAGADAWARYRLAAVAIARVESYIGPTPDGPRYMRIGARAPAPANTSTVPAETAPDTLAERCADANASCEQLRAELLAQQDDGMPGFAEFCHGLAEAVTTSDMSALPSECMRISLPIVPKEIATDTPFRHQAQVLPTPPLPEFIRPKRPPNGWWPHSIRNIVKPWALERIQQWFQDMREWHAAGGPPESRPKPRAFGPDALYAAARGYKWDLRGGPGNVRLLGEDGPNPQTEINGAEAAQLLADCPDREIVDMLVQGVTFKVTSDEIAPEEQLQPFIVLNPNLLALYGENGTVACAEQIRDMCEHNWLQLITDAEAGLCMVPFIIRPRSVIDKKGTCEKRGICDNGAPRKRLLTDRSRLLFESPNVVARRAVWSHEDKPSLQDAVANGAVVRELGLLNNEPTFELAFDYSKYFHRVGYQESELWQMGLFVPHFTDGNATDLAPGVETAMSMGANPASQIGQRIGNAGLQKICHDMDEEERTRWEAGLDLTPECKAALQAREQLPSDSYGSQARLYDIVQYTDDEHAVVAGVQRVIRYLRHHWRIMGPEGINLPLSRASKQQAGAQVLWNGGHTAAAVGIVWVPPERSVRIAHDISMALNGVLPVGDYRCLLGQLANLLFMTGSDHTLLHHIFRPITPGNEIDGGPETLVHVDDLMRPVLERWHALVLRVGCCPALQAIRSTVGTSAARVAWRVRSDAALLACDNPGMGGWLYGYWWALAITEYPGLEHLDIPHLEFLAAACSLLTFGHILAPADEIILETDALATATSLTARARSASMRIILDALLQRPEYHSIAPRLRCAHCYGAGNPLADAASRGYTDTLESISRALGVTSTRLPPSTAAREMLDEVVPKLVRVLGANSAATSRGTHNLNMTGDMPVAHTHGTTEARGATTRKAAEARTSSSSGLAVLAGCMGVGVRRPAFLFALLLWLTPPVWGGGGSTGAGPSHAWLERMESDSDGEDGGAPWQPPDSTDSDSDGPEDEDVYDVGVIGVEDGTGELQFGTPQGEDESEPNSPVGSDQRYTPVDWPPSQGDPGCSYHYEQPKPGCPACREERTISMCMHHPPQCAAFECAMGCGRAQRCTCVATPSSDSTVSEEWCAPEEYTQGDPGCYIGIPPPDGGGTPSPVMWFEDPSFDDSTTTEEDLGVEVQGWRAIAAAGDHTLRQALADNNFASEERYLQWAIGIASDERFDHLLAVRRFRILLQSRWYQWWLRSAPTSSKRKQPMRRDPDEDDHGPSPGAMWAGTRKAPRGPQAQHHGTGSSSTDSTAGGSTSSGGTSRWGAISLRRVRRMRRHVPCDGKRARTTRRRARADPAAAGGTAYRYGSSSPPGPPRSPPTMPTLSIRRGAAVRTPPTPSGGIRSPPPKSSRSGPVQDGASASPSAMPMLIVPDRPAATLTETARGAVPPTRNRLPPTGLQQQRRELIQRTFDMLRNDDTEGASKADDGILMSVAETSVLGDPDVRPETSKAQLQSNWRAWERFCSWLVIDPIRPDISLLTPEGRKRETIFWTAALPFVYARMKPAPGRYLPNGQPAPPQPKNALAILRGVRKEHADRGIETPPLKLATRRAHELMLRYRDLNGPEALAAKRKAPLTHAIITGMLGIRSGEPVLPRGRPWHWNTMYGRSIRTLLHVAAQTGLRKAEVATHARSAWGKADLSFAHLTWRIRGVDHAVLTRAQLMSLDENCYAVLTVGSSKADQLGMRWGNKPIWLPYHPTAAINAARALADWEAVTRIPEGERRDTPLFWGESGDRKALKQSELTPTFERLLIHVLGPEIAKKYSFHSFRRYLASAMLSAKCSNAQIQAALRWASEEALGLYAVTEEREYGSWLHRAEQVQLTATMAHHLPRAMPTYDAEEVAEAFLVDRADTISEANIADRAIDDTITRVRRPTMGDGGGDVDDP